MKKCLRLTRSKTSIRPRTTRMFVPSQKSVVSQIVPVMVAAA
jgi:hypothetical protein